MAAALSALATAIAICLFLNSSFIENSPGCFGGRKWGRTLGVAYDRPIKTFVATPTLVMNLSHNCH